MAEDLFVRHVSLESDTEPTLELLLVVEADSDGLGLVRSPKEG
jgi:hypothetical protein